MSEPLNGELCVCHREGLCVGDPQQRVLFSVNVVSVEMSERQREREAGFGRRMSRFQGTDGCQRAESFKVPPRNVGSPAARVYNRGHLVALTRLSNKQKTNSNLTGDFICTCSHGTPESSDFGYLLYLSDN